MCVDAVQSGRQLLNISQLTAALVLNFHEDGGSMLLRNGITYHYTTRRHSPQDYYRFPTNKK